MLVEEMMNSEVVTLQPTATIADGLRSQHVNDKILVFRIQTINPLPVIQDLRDAGFTLMWLNNAVEPKL